MKDVFIKSGKKLEDISYFEVNGLGLMVIDLFELKVI